MDKTWQLQDAKSRFSEVVERASQGEVQIVTKHGQNTVAIISYAQFASWKADHTTLLEALRPDSELLESELLENTDLSSDLSDTEIDTLFARQPAKIRALDLE
jgi:prevent-host-death family protein